ncbi:MAG: NAD-dependent epimerase/dehydratase family protein, partial [bacterium]|nr:NAD-dependent epimerase/dehydratase family protein [bacterium]
HDTNAGGTLNLCLGAREGGVGRFVYCSSSEVYGTAEIAPMSEQHPLRPTTVYGARKLAGALYAPSFWRTYGLPVSVVRPFNTYGPREPWEGARAEVIPRFLLQLQAAEPPLIFGDGTQTRDFTYVDDTVTGLIGAAGCDDLVGDVVNVARGHEVSITRIAELLAQSLGVPEIAPVYGQARPGDVARHFGDVEKARRLFDYQADIDLEMGLARTIEWFREHPSASGGNSGASAPNW